MKKIAFTLLIIASLSSYTWACSCLNAGSFCEIFPSAVANNALIVKGSPDKIKGHGMTFKIEEVISGSNDTPNKITIWGDPGYLCRAYVTGFEKRDELMMILFPIETDRVESTTGYEEEVGDYLLSGCGQYFIYLNGKNAENPKCANVSTNKPLPITVYPNPVSSSFFFDINGEKVLGIKVFATNGALIFNQEQLIINQEKSRIQIETFHWIAGLYLVEIQTGQGKRLAKVMKI